MEATQKVFRFKIHTQELLKKMKEFAQLHAFEERILLKENYELWTNDDQISCLIEQEKETIDQLGYHHENSIENKIFTSIKYYHIKNILTDMRQKTAKRADDLVYDVQYYDNKKKWQNEVKFSKLFIKMVREFIQHKDHSNLAPAKSLKLFLQDHNENCQNENNTLSISNELFHEKLKKMFKNQYYNLKCKLNS